MCWPRRESAAARIAARNPSRSQSERRSEAKGDQQRKPRLSTNVMGYEVTELEMAALAHDIKAESKRDSILYLLDILTAVLSSERSPDLLSKLFDIYEGILKSLFQGGHWIDCRACAGIIDRSRGHAARPQRRP